MIRKVLVVAAVLAAMGAQDSMGQIGRRRGALRDRIGGGRDRAAHATIEHGGITRTYVVRQPLGAARRDTPMPVVLMLHGGGGHAENAEQMTGFTEKGRKEGFLVVYPEGTSRLNRRLLTWNAGHCCGYAMTEKVDDTGFILALLDRLQRDYPVDPNRIYITGMSNGAMMSHRLGRELSRRVAAIAPVVGTLFGDEPKPVAGVSIIAINGALDKSVPHEGGPPGGRASNAWDGTPAKPYTEQGRYWAEANGCDPTPVTESKPERDHVKYKCPSGKAVELYLVKDNGHAWPGGQAGSARGDSPSKSMNATDVIWEFFKAHPRVD